MEIRIGEPQRLWLLACVATCLLLAALAIVTRRHALLRFASSRLRSQILPSGTQLRSWLSAVLLSSCLALLTLALLDVRWGRMWQEVPQKGIEVMFLLDVSRSMLAEDASPNRLARAKQQIMDLVDEMPGDRVGLTIFAGDTQQSVPMTNHYEDFKQVLDAVGPHSVRRGGSRLGDALAAAATGFLNKMNNQRTIVVFTDGEDQESAPVDVARKLNAEQGVRIFTVGLGDMDQGARIPADESQRGGGYVQHEGEQVWSKMNGTILDQIAAETGGAYIPAGTKRVNMADVYQRYFTAIDQQEFETAKINAYIARYQWFAAPALALLLLEVLVSTRSAKMNKLPGPPASESIPAADEKTKMRRTQTFRCIFVAVVGLCVLLFQASRIPVAFAQADQAAASTPSTASTSRVAAVSQESFASPEAKLNAANALVRDGELDRALELYEQLGASSAQHEVVNYNAAVAQYRKGNLGAAEKLFSQVIAGNETSVAAQARYNLGNCFYAKALQTASQDQAVAIDQLKQAIAHYRGALRSDSTLTDARANIELAATLIQQLQQQQQQQQPDQQQDKEQSQSQDQDSQSQDSPSENSEEPKSDQQQPDEPKSAEQKDGEKKKDGEQASDANQESDGQPSVEQDADKNSEGASKDNEAGEQRSAQPEPKDPKSKQPNQSQSEDAGGNEPADAGEQQGQQPSDKADEPNFAGAPNDPRKSQLTPQGNLTAGNEQEGLESEGSRAAESSRVVSMTHEEALKMLQAVRDRDMLRRLQQQRIERSRRITVDKDW